MSPPSCHRKDSSMNSSIATVSQLTDCNAFPSPHCSGFVVDCIPADSKSPSAKFITQHQSLLGCLTWLHMSKRPDFGIAHKLLCAHLQSPSSTGHMTAAKHVLSHLKGSATRGIRFSSQGTHGKLTCSATTLLPVPANQLPASTPTGVPKMLPIQPTPTSLIA